MGARSMTRRMPSERESITVGFKILSSDSTHHTCEVCGHSTEEMRGTAKGWFTVGLYEDGTVGELFTRLDKAGSTAAGLFDAFAIAVSMLLREGVPLETIVTKFRGHRFEPSGRTAERGPDAIRVVSSPVDLVMRWLDRRFLTVPTTAPKTTQTEEQI